MDGVVLLLAFHFLLVAQKMLQTDQMLFKTMHSDYWGPDNPQ